MTNKTKHHIKKHFFGYCLHCFLAQRNKNVMQKIAQNQFYFLKKRNILIIGIALRILKKDYPGKIIL